MSSGERIPYTQATLRDKDGNIVGYAWGSAEGVMGAALEAAVEGLNVNIKEGEYILSEEDKRKYEERMRREIEGE
jgi:hypothetical protein